LVVHRAERLKILIGQKGDDRHKLLIVVHGKEECHAVFLHLQKALVAPGTQIGDELLQIVEGKGPLVRIVVELGQPDIIGSGAIIQGSLEIADGLVHQGFIPLGRDKLTEILQDCDEEILNGEIKSRFMRFRIGKRKAFGDGATGSCK